MKIKTLLLYSFAFLLITVLTSSKFNPSNPPLAKTGAPGESTCQESGCHGGGSFTGMVALSGIPDTIVPGTVYNITLTHTSNAARAGFELTVLDSLNVKAGALTASSGSNIANSGGRSYLRHSTFKTLSAGMAAWTFKWTAPATAAGDEVTFWFTSLAANGNGNTAGDNVIKSSKKVIFDKTTATSEPDLSSQFKIYPNPAKSSINISMPVENAELELWTLDGKLAQSKSISNNSSIDISSLISGSYIAKISYGNRLVTKILEVR